MVQIRKKTAVNYAEPLPNEGLDSEDDEEMYEEEPVVKAKSPKPRAQPRKRRADKLQEIEADTTLLSAVKSQSAAIAVAAKDWVARYSNNRAAATAELFTLLLQAAGSTDRPYTAEEVEHSGADELREIADKELHENGYDDGIGGTTRQARLNFAANFRELWDKILREASAAERLQDGYFLERLINFVVALSTSPVRQIRRIGATIAMQISISLLHVARQQEEIRDLAQEQEQAEKRKQGNAAAKRAAEFARTVQQRTSRIEDLLEYVDTVFNSVVTTRCKDIDPEIRASVADGVSHWARLLPAKFLNSTYLKYPLILITDSDPGVRAVAINAMIRLYAIEGNAASIADATARFQPRFMELIDDVDDTVAAAGLKLAALLIKQKALPATSVGRVYQLLVWGHEAQRKAAAELISVTLKDTGLQALQEAGMMEVTRMSPVAKKGRGKAAAAANKPIDRSEAELKLAGLLHILQHVSKEFSEAGVRDEEAVLEADQSLVGTVVDGLYDHLHGCLDNWSLLVTWLSGDDAFDLVGDQGPTLLALIQYWATRKASGLAMPGQESNPKLKGKAAKDAATAKQEATAQLMQSLPGLLQKYQSNPSTLVALIEPIRCFRLELYALKNEEKELVGLCKTVKDTMFKHGSATLASVCAETLEYCASSGPAAAKEDIKVVLMQAVDKSCKALTAAVKKVDSAGTGRLQRALKAWRESDGSEEDPLLFSLRSALVQWQALQERFYNGVSAKYNPTMDACYQVLELASSDSTALPAGIVIPAAKIMFYGAMTRLKRVKELGNLDAADNTDNNNDNQQAEDQQAVQAALEELVEAVMTLSGALESVAAVAGRKDDLDVLAGLCRIQADMMTLFSKKLLGEALEAAAYEPSNAVFDAFWTACDRFLQDEEAPDTPEVVLKRRPQESEDAFQQRQKLHADKESVRKHRRALAQREIAEAAAQMVSYNAVAQWRSLAAQLVMYWGNSNATVSDVIKSLIKDLKKNMDPSLVPAIYLDAMKEAFRRCRAQKAAADLAQDANPQHDDDEEDEDDSMMYLVDFVVLCEAIIQEQGNAISPAALSWLVTEAGKWVLSGGVERLDFLHGAYIFMSKLKGAAAESALTALEASALAAGVPQADDDDDDEQWSLFHQYLDGLRAGARKGKSALKKNGATPGSGGGGTGGGNANKGNRKISFADKAAAAAEEDQDDNQAEEEEEEEQPKKQQKRGATTGAGRKKAAVAKPQVEEESEEESEEDEDAWPEDNDGGEEEQEEEGYEGVMPTEEQLPGHGRGGEREDDESEEEEEPVPRRRRH